MLDDYAAFWQNILGGDFTLSWSTLQDIQDRLRVIKRFNSDKREYHLQLIENQCVELEKLYPYSIFASIEAVIEEIKCSICGSDMNSFECPHITGELYAGEMASEIVCKLTEVPGVAMTKNPRDKRCIVEPNDPDLKKEGFKKIAYLASLVEKRELNPWQFDRVKELMKPQDSSASMNVGRNDPCPCGSGIKYKKCCLAKRVDSVPYTEVVGKDRERPIWET